MTKATILAVSVVFLGALTMAVEVVCFVPHRFGRVMRSLGYYVVCWPVLMVVYGACATYDYVMEHDMFRWRR